MKTKMTQTLLITGALAFCAMAAPVKSFALADGFSISSSGSLSIEENQPNTSVYNNPAYSQNERTSINLNAGETFISAMVPNGGNWHTYPVNPVGASSVTIYGSVPFGFDSRSVVLTFNDSHGVKQTVVVIMRIPT